MEVRGVGGGDLSGGAGCSDVAFASTLFLLCHENFMENPFFLPFQALPACPIQATCEAASKEENKEKNRYVNILPCTYRGCLDGGGGKHSGAPARTPHS